MGQASPNGNSQGEIKGVKIVAVSQCVEDESIRALLIPLLNGLRVFPNGCCCLYHCDEENLYSNMTDYNRFDLAYMAKSD